uniref:Uncharacterized protein n=1 Tax=Tanacetum cinerariifolium TaxID=118510 RepID=A0A699UYX2_TANCI|nr:hypothetical protein [Tanacetum cinerariifolium]
MLVQVVIAQRKHRVVGVVHLRYQVGVLGFVKEWLVAKANAERVEVGRVAGGQGRHHARIDAAAQERAQRHVGHEAARHGLVHQGHQLFLLLLVIKLVFGDFFGVVGNFIPALAHHFVALDEQVVAGQQLLDALENGGWPRNVIELQVLV